MLQARCASRCIVVLVIRPVGGENPAQKVKGQGFAISLLLLHPTWKKFMPIIVKHNPVMDYTTASGFRLKVSRFRVQGCDTIMNTKLEILELGVSLHYDCIVVGLLLSFPKTESTCAVGFSCLLLVLSLRLLLWLQLVLLRGAQSCRRRPG